MIPKDYQCEGQLNVFDIVRLNEYYQTLPDIETVISEVSQKFNIAFVESIADWDNSGRKVFKKKFPKAELEIHESWFMENGERFISVWWNGKDWGIGNPSHNLEEVFKAIEREIARCNK